MKKPDVCRFSRDPRDIGHRCRWFIVVSIMTITSCGGGGSNDQSMPAQESVLAPNARMRKHVVPRQPKTNTDEKHAHHEPKHKPEPSQIHDPLIAPLTWAQRLKRVFNIDITLCPRCGGTLRVIAEITDPVIIQKILDHVAQPPPEVNPAATSS